MPVRMIIEWSNYICHPPAHQRLQPPRSPSHKETRGSKKSLKIAGSSPIGFDHSVRACGAQAASAPAIHRARRGWRAATGAVRHFNVLGRVPDVHSRGRVKPQPVERHLQGGCGCGLRRGASSQHILGAEYRRQAVFAAQLAAHALPGCRLTPGPA